jgi:mycothiol synthase
VIEVVDINGVTAPDELLVQLARVQNEATAELAGGAPVPTETERLARYRNPASTIRYWLALLDGEPAGFAYLGGHSPTFVTADIAVLPRFRRRGVATALFERVRAAARERELPSFVAHYGNEAGAAFAQTVGGHDDQRDVKSVLRLRHVELPEPRPPEGVVLRSWVGACPDELVESFVVARSAISDAPVAGELALPPWTVERQRDDERAIVARGLELHSTAALEAGDVVAITAVRVQPGGFAVTDDTATLPSHRGRGLATAVKVESLRRLREARPDVELVGTMNAERNAAMLAVNRKLGFEPTVVLTCTVVTL